MKHAKRMTEYEQGRTGFSAIEKLNTHARLKESSTGKSLRREDDSYSQYSGSLAASQKRADKIVKGNKSLMEKIQKEQKIDALKS